MCLSDLSAEEIHRAWLILRAAARIARSLSIAPSTLTHHLDALEDAGLAVRAKWEVRDGRKVAVRPTDEGRYAVRRLGAMSSPAIASP